MDNYKSDSDKHQMPFVPESERAVFPKMTEALFIGGKPFEPTVENYKYRCIDCGKYYARVCMCKQKLKYDAFQGV